MTYEGIRIAVAIPAYNAEQTLLEVVRNVPEFVDCIVVVDDGSLDGTGKLPLSASDPRVKVLRNSTNLGVGGAMKAAYRAALDEGAEIVVKMDADGQMDAHGIPDLLQPLLAGDAGYAKGNRLWSRVSAKDMPLPRLVGNLLLSFATKAASGYWTIFDPTNGFTAIRADILRRLDFDAIQNRYYFETSMLVELHIRRVPVHDTLMTARYQGAPSSLSLVSASFEFSYRLLASFARRVALEYFVLDLRPGTLFGVAGLLGVLSGLTFGLYHWWLGEMAGISSLPGTVMVAAIPVIVGTQLLLQAIALDMSESRHFPALRPLLPRP